MTLHLVLKKQWYDMIASGEKKEEYRELKTFWAKRLCHGIKTYISQNLHNYGYEPDYKKFDTVTFQHGYAKDAPRVVVEFKGIEIGKGKSEWGATEECFIIKLGEIIKP